MSRGTPRTGYIISDIDDGNAIHVSAELFVRERLQYWFPEMRALQEEGVSCGVDLVVDLTIFSPLIDEELLKKMLEISWETGHAFQSVDSIPGTSPVRVYHASTPNSNLHSYFSLMQPKYCTNFNIQRPNRALIFSRLVMLKPLLAKQSLREILEYIESDQGLDFVVSYGEGVDVRSYLRCPYCDSDKVQAIHSGSSHPITGFITKNNSVFCEIPYSLNNLIHFSNKFKTKENVKNYLDSI